MATSVLFKIFNKNIVGNMRWFQISSIQLVQSTICHSRIYFGFDLIRLVTKIINETKKSDYWSEEATKIVIDRLTVLNWLISGLRLHRKYYLKILPIKLNFDKN